jgi:hypothetical protein
MNTLIARLHEWTDALGRAGIVGIGLAVFAAALSVSSVAPARIELTRLQTLAEHAAREGGESYARSDASASGADQLERFQRRLPPFSDAPAMVLKLHAIAAANGVMLETGEYQLVKDRASDIVRYQITLPIRASYRQVRLFLAQLMDEITAVSLDEISIRRDSIDARAAETRVRLTAYFSARP